MKGKNQEMCFKMFSYNRTIPKMRCQAYNTLIENPGENNLGALPTSLTRKLEYRSFNHIEKFDYFTNANGMRISSSVAVSSPSLDPSAV